jgi:hypothetical protein
MHSIGEGDDGYEGTQGGKGGREQPEGRLVDQLYTFP